MKPQLVPDDPRIYTAPRPALPPVRKAKTNASVGVTTYFVPSEADPKREYMVVEICRDGITIRFCQCPDFFTRRLPTFGTGCFQGCKHCLRVVDAIERGDL